MTLYHIQFYQQNIAVINCVYADFEFLEMPINESVHGT